MQNLCSLIKHKNPNVLVLIRNWAVTECVWAHLKVPHGIWQFYCFDLWFVHMYLIIVFAAGLETQLYCAAVCVCVCGDFCCFWIIIIVPLCAPTANALSFFISSFFFPTIPSFKQFIIIIYIVSVRMSFSIQLFDAVGTICGRLLFIILLIWVWRRVTHKIQYIVGKVPTINQYAQTDTNMHTVWWIDEANQTRWFVVHIPVTTTHLAVNTECI